MISKALFLSAIMLSLITVGCKKTKACLDEDSYLIAKNETLRIESCSKNADVYTWELDGERLSYGLGAIFDYYELIDGGGSCDNFVELTFNEAGSHTLTLNAAKLKDGSCSSGNFDSTFGKDIEAEITVTE